MKKCKKVVAFAEKSVTINQKSMNGNSGASRRKGGTPVRFKKTSFWTKLLLLIVVIYAVVTLVDLQDRISSANAEIAALEEQVLYAEQENALVEQELADFGSDRSITKLARSRLGMVEVGEIVFYDSDDQ
jgi:cell division protein FtsB